MRTLLAALLAATLSLVAAAARAADPPEAVYQKVHTALLATDVNGMIRHATAAQRAELQAAPGKEQIVKFMAAGMPKTYTVSALRIAPGGKTAVMHAAGMGGLMGPPAMMYGVVSFAMEGADWKVAKIDWSNKKPAALKAP